MRDDNFKLSQEKREAILYELGDVLWYLANLANELEICQHSRRHEFGETEKTQSQGHPQRQRRQAMKLDQLAFYCVAMMQRCTSRKLWACRTPDGPTTRSPVKSQYGVSAWSHGSGVNVAELQFCESWGMQLEIIRYVDGLHWCMSTPPLMWRIFSSRMPVSTSTTMTGLHIWLTKSWCSRHSPSITQPSQTGLISTGYTRWLRARTSSIFRGSRNDCR